jgi:hypothetical protein
LPSSSCGLRCTSSAVPSLISRCRGITRRVDPHCQISWAAPWRTSDQPTPRRVAARPIRRRSWSRLTPSCLVL